MSDFDDMTYYAFREKAEREMADRTSDPTLSGIHREMADLYLARTKPAWPYTIGSPGSCRDRSDA